jgi:competence protein ComEA
METSRGSSVDFAAALLVCVIALVALARSEVQPDVTAVAARRAARPAPTAAAVAQLRTGQSIDLNRAQAGDLQLLPGIGPKLAQRIVDERTRRGAFTSVSELRAVSGVGAVKFARIQPFVRVGAQEVAPIDRAPGTP